jgi:hypothetical protein
MRWMRGLADIVLAQQRRRTPHNSRDEGSICVSMTKRAVSASPHLDTAPAPARGVSTLGTPRLFEVQGLTLERAAQLQSYEEHLLVR